MENLPEIVRVKIKSLILIVIYSTMIVGLPIVVGFCRRLGRRKGQGRETDLLVATICVVFVLATLKSIADVTQVAQLGRYYLPVFALMLPAGIAGLIEWLDVPGFERRIVPVGGRHVLRFGVGRSDMGLRRVVAGQALSASLAGPERGRRVDRGPSGPRVSPGPDHDLVSLGAASHERPDHRPHAPQLQPKADQGGDGPVRGDAHPLGLV